MLAIIPNRKIWYIFSGVLVVASIVVLAMWGLKLGIDFTGGSLAEINFVAEIPENAQTISETIGEADIENPTVQSVDADTYLVRTRFLNEEEHQKMLTKMNERFVQVEEVRFETIGPTIGKELREKAIYAIIIVIIAIVLYIAYAFRKVSIPVASWKYGVAAIIALVHDVLIVAGIFAVLGHFLNVEVDTMFVTALLTILGFSVHDSIVVFDRTRYNLLKGEGEGRSFSEVVNMSVNQTLVRSLNTSITTFVILFSIYLLGGETIKWFVLALMIGIVIGTYSSIFIASPVIVTWEKYIRLKKNRTIKGGKKNG